MLDPLYHLAANAIVFFHKGFGPIFGADSFFAWAASVVALVIAVRILIFPLFVKQVKSQRTMQMMQPRIKEIREKYGHDKQRMQLEIMQLQKEHGNPLLGCLPILLQIPLFISLFHVFTHLAPMNEGPGGSLVWRPRVGLSADQVEQIASAKLWGISLSSEFGSSQDFLDFLQADGTNVKILAVVLILLMGATTFLTQRQIMARTGPVDPQQAMVQKVLLYGSPIMLAVFGFQFPIAVLLYWLTTNLWSMGQQFFVIKKMPPLKPLGAGGKVPGARPAPSDGAVAATRPAPGARAGAKSKNRSRPAGPSLDKAADATTRTGQGGDRTAASASTRSGGRASTAPPGTRSRSGASGGGAGVGAEPAANGSGATKAGTAKAGAARTGSGKAGANGAAKKSGVKNAIVDDAREAGSGSNGAAAGTQRASGVSEPSGVSEAGRVSESEGAARPTPPPVPAGVRRQPGGSRPAKRRGKGKRPGGRR